MSDLSAAIDAVIDEILNANKRMSNCSNYSKKVFIRLSTRSPKDAVDKCPSKRSALIDSIASEFSSAAQLK